MFAVVETGNKQYQVQVGDVIKTERLEGDVGTVIALDKVLITSQKVGAPLVEGAIVEAEILDQRKDDKVLVFKKKRRHNYRRKKGHRQYITVLKVTNIKSQFIGIQKMATKKAGGSSRNGRDSKSKRLGLKKSGGQPVISGNIIVRQRGTKVHPGNGVGMGRDHTIYAVIPGTVQFRRRQNNKLFVDVVA